MKLSHFMLLAGVAAISLGACSSSAGPGEIGSKDDIVVRNHGSVPAPAAAEEAAMLAQGADGQVAVADMQTAAGEGEQMVPRTPDEAQAMADAAEPAIRQNVEEATVPMAQKPAMMSQEVPDEALEPKAAPAPARTSASVDASADVAAQGEPIAEPVPAAPVESAPVADIDPQTTAGTIQRPAPVPDATAEVKEPEIDAAATEYAQEGVDQAAQKALANPPVSPPEPAIEGGAANTTAAAAPVNAAPQAAPAPVPAQPQQQAAAPVAPPVTPSDVDSIRPTPDQLSNYGMRVVKKEDGTLEAKPYAQSVAEGTVSATPVAPAAPAVQPQQVASATQAAAAPEKAAAPALGIVPATFNPNDPTFLRTLQKALQDKGFYTGEVSGENSADLMNSVVRYQTASGLTVGGINQETARHLGLIK